MAKAPKDDMSKVADAVRDFLEDLTKSAEKTAKLVQQDPDAKQIRKLQTELKAIEQMTKSANDIIKQLGDAAKAASKQ
jgi:hypothetical protein